MVCCTAGCDNQATQACLDRAEDQGWRDRPVLRRVVGLDRDSITYRCECCADRMGPWDGRWDAVPDVEAIERALDAPREVVA